MRAAASEPPRYIVTLPAPPYEARVSTLQEAARLLGPTAQSRQVSRALTTGAGAHAGLAPLTEAERFTFLRAAERAASRQGGPLGGPSTRESVRRLCGADTVAVIDADAIEDAGPARTAASTGARLAEIASSKARIARIASERREVKS